MAKDVSAGLSAQGRRFGVTVGTAFLVFAGIAAWRGHPLALRILASLGGVLVVAGLLAPRALLPVERRWMQLAHLISRVTTPIIMGVLFFVVITPMGVLRRAFGRHGLPRYRSGESAWRDRADGSRRSNLSRQF
ncbi:MAG TPA: SxtJ family membrane protein [Gemmatimonadaceae bacterium]|nr:SxtJ family membrane protein [Gemmatimonadaceae bacterium]